MTIFTLILRFINVYKIVIQINDKPNPKFFTLIKTYMVQKNIVTYI